MTVGIRLRAGGWGAGVRSSAGVVISVFPTAVHSASHQQSAAVLSPVGHQQGCEVDLHLAPRLRMREYTSPLVQLSHGVLLNRKQGRHFYH